MEKESRRVRFWALCKMRMDPERASFDPAALDGYQHDER